MLIILSEYKGRRLSYCQIGFGQKSRVFHRWYSHWIFMTNSLHTPSDGVTCPSSSATPAWRDLYLAFFQNRASKFRCTA